MNASLYTSGEYLQTNPSWHEEYGPWKAGHVAKILCDNRINPTSVCEVGTGAGETLRLLSEMLPKATLKGYDIAEQAIKRALAKSSDRLTFELGSPFGKQERCDLVLTMDVFEHVEDYMGFLRNVRQLGRYQVYNIPLDLSARTVLQGGGILHQRSAVGHLHYFFKDTALATLRDTGHEVIDWFYTSRAFFWGRNPIRWPMVAIRRVLYRANPDLAARLLGGFSMTVLCR